MKKKLSSILGVGLALVLVVSLMGAFMPAEKVEAQAYTPNQWNVMAIPGAVGQVLRAANVADIAIGSDGTTMYAVDTQTAGILRSTNGGQTWAVVAAPVFVPAFTAPARLVAVSPDDPNVMVIVDSGGAGADRVYYSTNGGAVWVDLGAPARAGEVIYDITISSARATAILGRDIAVATSDPIGGTLGDIWLIGATTTWVAVGIGAGWGYDYTSVAFEPNWVGGRAVVAVASDGTGTFLQIRRTSTPVTTILNTRMNPTGVTDPTEVGLVPNQILSSSLALPSDFDSTSALSQQAYVGWTSLSGFDDVYRVDFNQARKLQIAANIGIWSVAFSGTLVGGTLFAGQTVGAVGAGAQIWHSENPQTALPTWTISYKPPTGATGPVAANVVVAVAPDFGTSNTVYAGTSGAESGFSKSINAGVSYNQLSLVDTTINTLDDVMPVPDNSQVFLSTTNTTTNRSSLWLSSTPPSVASWERVRLRGGVAFIIRLSPDYLDDATIYWCDVGATAIQKSTSGGSIFSTRTAPAAIIDVVVESKDVLYMADAANVRQSTNGAWFFGLPIASQTTGVSTLAMAPSYPDKPVAGNVLVGGIGGFVSLSTDGGGSFTPLLAAVPTGVNMQVLADKDYADNNMVYAGSADAAGAGLFRYEVGTSTAWESIRSLADVDAVTAGNQPGLVYGLAMHCGVLYAGFDAPAAVITSSADRSLSPTLPDIASLVFDRMNVGAGAARFNVMPSALRVAGGETDVWLWAINTAVNALMGYNDTMAKVAPSVEVPAEVGFDPNTGRNAAFIVSWNKVSNALAYRAEIYIDEACTQRATRAAYNIQMGVPGGLVFDAYAAPSTLSPSWYVLPGVISSGTTYYVRVVARDQVPRDAIRGPWSEAESFTVEMGVPVQAPGVGPALLGPTPGGMDVPLRPGFSWGPMAGTTEYEFILATDAELTSTIAGTPVTVSSPSWQCTTDLAYGTTYFWGVRAWAPTTSAQSVGTFTTIVEPAPAVFTCEVCGLTFTSRAALEAHIAKVHIVEPVTPPTPGYIWAIIGIGAVLVVVVIALIMRTRRPV